jgi:predicted phage terminase large subunit-like protein
MTASHQVTEAEVLRQVTKAKCEESHLYFSRYFFKQRQGIKFIVNWHHQYMAEALEQVLRGECDYLVINVPPGSSKTEMAVINFMARGLALNPDAKFLHLSSGDDLVLLNSQTTREIVQSDEFQAMWPMRTADDASAKKRWNVMIDERMAGGVYAVSLGGQITGFRAGRMVPGFQGAIVIDDPLKADDAFSAAAIRVANRRLLSTVKSRKANPRTPIVVIMQRVGEMDPSGFIKAGNLPGQWKFITIPALIDDEYVAALPPHIAALVPADAERDDKGRFSYWPYKEPLKDMLALESGTGTDGDGNRISRFVFNSQYMQAPIAIGGNLIRGSWFPRVAMTPKILYRIITADTAMKTGERNDYSVFQCWGKGEDGKAYLLDQMRGKWEAPELKSRAIEFWNKHKAVPGQGMLRKMFIEDKASGIGLIQDLKRNHSIPITGIERIKDKLTRVMDVIPFMESGYVMLLENSPFLSDFIAECEAFTADDSHAHDDQIDPLCDGINELLATGPRSIFS